MANDATSNRGFLDAFTVGTQAISKSGEFALIGGEYLLRRLNLEAERQWECMAAQPGISETAPIFP
jgi:hypothetical protein